MENLVLNERTMHILFIYNIRILKRYQDKKEMGRRRYHAMGGLFVWELEKLDGDAVRIMQIYHLTTRIGPLIVGDGGAGWAERHDLWLRQLRLRYHPHRRPGEQNRYRKVGA